MNKRIKLFLSTPTLYGEDANRIITEAKKLPSKKSIERNKRMLEKVRKATCKNGAPDQEPKLPKAQ